MSNLVEIQEVLFSLPCRSVIPNGECYPIDNEKGWLKESVEGYGKMIRGESNHVYGIRGGVSKESHRFIQEDGESIGINKDVRVLVKSLGEIREWELFDYKFKKNPDGSVEYPRGLSSGIDVHIMYSDGSVSVIPCKGIPSSDQRKYKVSRKNPIYQKKGLKKLCKSLGLNYSDFWKK